MKNPFTALKNRLTKSNQNGSGIRYIKVPNEMAGIPITHDSALTYSAIWRCVNLISESIAGLPWSVNERFINTSGRKESKHLIAHPLSSILDLIPNDEVDALAWRQTMVAWALTYGNGYSEIEKDGAGRPVGLWQLEPNRVNPDRTNDGQLVYDISNGSAPNTVLRPDQIYHLKGLGFDGLVGYSVIGYAQKTVGLGLSAEQYGASFYENGAQASMIFEHPNQIGDKALGHLRESLDGTHKGVRNSHKNMILEEGLTAKQITIPQDDAQFIESRKFQNTEVARWYGVPPHKLMEMEKATFNNIEQQNIEFATDALLPWIKRLELEANIKLIAPRNRGKVFTKLNLNGLLRGDTDARSKYYKNMWDMGALSSNDIREFEDLNPIGPEGDKYLVQLNLTTLEKVGEEPAEPVDDPNQDDSTGMELIENSMSKILRREHHRTVEAFKKFGDDRAGLESYLSNFYDQHKEYIKQELSPLMKHFKVEACLDAYVDAHKDIRLIEAMVAYDYDKTDQPFSSTANDMTKTLLGV